MCDYMQIVTLFEFKRVKFCLLYSFYSFLSEGKLVVIGQKIMSEQSFRQSEKR